MPHARDNIKQKFLTKLTGNTIAGNSVFINRLQKLDDATLPAIIIFTKDEEIITTTISFPRTQDRLLKVTVECYAKGAGAEGEVDQIAKQVEELILSNINLDGLVKNCKLESTEFIFNNDGQLPLSVTSLMFLVNYQTKENNAEIII